MKNLLTALFLVLSINAMSQTSFGIKGGLTLGKIIGETRVDYTATPGFILGVLYNQQLMGHASFQAELNYTTKLYGNKQSMIDAQQNPIGSFNYKSKNSYLELPLLIKYTKKEGVLRPYAIGGATISYLLSSKTMRGGMVVSYIEPEFVSVDVFKKLDMGATIGVGTDIVIGKTTVIIEARYNQGFISMYKPSTTKTKEPKVYNSYLSLTTGIRF